MTTRRISNCAWYADSLIEEGKPRGEFIALQGARAGSAQAPSRGEKQLLKTHGRQWLGSLDSVALRSGVEFDCGFVSALRYRNNEGTQNDGV